MALQKWNVAFIGVGGHIVSELCQLAQRLRFPRHPDNTEPGHDGQNAGGEPEHGCAKIMAGGKQIICPSDIHRKRSGEMALRIKNGGQVGKAHPPHNGHFTQERLRRLKSGKSWMSRSNGHRGWHGAVGTAEGRCEAVECAGLGIEAEQVGRTLVVAADFRQQVVVGIAELQDRIGGSAGQLQRQRTSGLIALRGKLPLKGMRHDARRRLGGAIDADRRVLLCDFVDLCVAQPRHHGDAERHQTNRQSCQPDGQRIRHSSQQQRHWIPKIRHGFKLFFTSY